MRVRHPAGSFALAVLLTLGAEAAQAQSPADLVVEQLREHGYTEFEVSRTLLGRVHIIARTPGGTERELVFNPATGEVLRDYLEAADGTPAPRILDRPEDDVAAAQGAGAVDNGEGPRNGGNSQGNGNGGQDGNSGGGRGNAGGNGHAGDNGHGNGNGD